MIDMTFSELVGGEPVEIDKQSPEPDASFRARLLRLATEDDRHYIEIAGPYELDSFGTKYNLPREGI